MLIKLGYVYEMWHYGIKSPIYWNTDKVAHCMCSGVTGGGKTVLSQIIVNQILNECKNCDMENGKKIEIKDIYLCDFKAGGDWNNIVPNYGEYIECDDILNGFYESFVDTIKQKQHKEKYLIFDEFPSYALSKDTKEFKNIMSKISHIGFMGRSFGYHLFFIGQQFSSKVMDTAIREQFSIKIYMGSTISTESATMLFPNCEIDKSVHLPKCCGYISVPEKDLDIIQIPFISEPAKLKRLLMKKGGNTIK